MAAVVLPLASKIVGADSGTYFFPPLGGMDGIALIGLVALCLGGSLGVYFLVAIKPVKSSSRVTWAALLFAAVCLLGYLSTYQRFVRRIEIPSRGASVYISVGYQRTPFAERTFGSASDWEMLRARGPNEEEVARLWTAKSIIIARLALYFLCTLTTLALLFLFSFGVAHDVARQADASATKH
ncbi:MAG: hypothetical protein ACRD3Q_01160 [Terriglobales bacterium]